MASGEKPLWPGPLPDRPFDVVGVGQCSLDQVALVERPPRFAGKERIQALWERPGGQIATALLTCQGLGLRSALISSVGDDAAAERTQAPLRAAGVDLSGVRVVPGARSQSAFILVDEKSGERTVLWNRDPDLSFEVSALRRSEIVRGRVLHLDAGDLDVSVWAAGVARQAGMAVVLDVDTLAPGIDALLRLADFPVVSSQFAEAYFGTRSPAEALRGLAGLGARFPVVTLGDRGAVGGVEDPLVTRQAFEVEARDTTGAGDVFHGAFIFALLEGQGAVQSLRTANAAAAMNCRALGAQGGLPSRAELLAFLDSQDRTFP